MAIVSVPVRYHSRGWILVPVTICGVWNGDFILNTFRFHSTVSTVTATTLDGFQCLGRRDGNNYVLRGLAIGGVRLPDLEARIGASATMLGVEGMLGLNFLKQFSRIQFDADEALLTLDLR